MDDIAKYPKKDRVRTKFIWIPRVLSIIFILFLSLFALDMFGGEAPLIEKIGGFLIHLIPSFVLVFILIISWKRPLLGGIAFVIMSILFTIRFRTYNHIFTFLAFSVTLAVCGILYIIADKIEKKRLQ